MYIAIDIGGTKTEIGFYNDKQLSSFITSEIFPTSQDFEDAKKIITSQIQSRVRGAIEGIGIAFPGVVSKEGAILQASNIPDYKGKPLKQSLESACRTDVSIVQDSPCAAVAEFVYGNLKGYSRIVHLIMGTGLGGTFVEVTKDHVIASPIEACGMIVDVQQGRTHKFNKTKGLLEAYVGGGNIENFYRRELSAVRDDDPLWKEVSHYMAVGINNISCILKPEVVVIGGGIGQKRKKALSGVPEEVQHYTEFVEPPKVVFTDIEGNSSLIGALAINFVDNLVLNN